jgi:hypothetical protein
MKEGEAVDCGISFAAAQLRRTGSGSGRKTEAEDGCRFGGTGLRPGTQESRRWDLLRW